jgi:hydrogenase maturation protein HypF
MESRRVRVRGVVQGVGFRPFVYRIAHEHGLTGHVRNLGDAGVEILVRGPIRSLELFLSDLQQRAPKLSRLDHVEVMPADDEEAPEFRIIPSSEAAGQGGGQLPPDVATCDACIEEILGSSRFHGYWATSCTDCGPRFTVVEALPYDRPRTSMRAFPMCDACAKEYGDPLDRRYHAQTTACVACGPSLSFDGDVGDALARAVVALAEGRILAIKGIGGTHIACDATQPDVVQTLRERLGRPSQPFAVMGCEEVLERVVILLPEDRDELLSPQRPILVLPKKTPDVLSGVAPGLHTVGAMLPYSGLHHLLLSSLGVPLVMTSANRPGQPMLIQNREIADKLGGIVDHLLLHDRQIVARCDDSVRRRVGGRLVFLRRSRGFVPDGIDRDLGTNSVLALGPESDVTFALYDRSRITLSQHIGTVDDVETLAYLQDALRHLTSIVQCRPPSVIACDLHPGFLTTQLAAEIAQEVGASRVQVQHHVAHLLSLVAEHEIEDGLIGIILDGFGYGDDGSAWGGELLMARMGKVRRLGSLIPVRLPGGDLAARHPLRMVASLLHAAGWSDRRISTALAIRGMRAAEAQVLLNQIGRGVYSPWTSSAGRFLDAVAAWLGVGDSREYEGEPAMRLEALAACGTPYPIDPRTLSSDGVLQLDTPSLFEEMVELSASGSAADAAATAQQALAEGISRMAMNAAERVGIKRIGLSGGVAYNDHIASAIRSACEGEGFGFYTNQLVPCGDGGISFGQAVYAAAGWTLIPSSDEDA